MYFSIDSTTDVPIYEQIVRQVQLAVADGTLTGGQMLPSVRQLARDLPLNPNTIARAYRDLQTHGVVEPLRGRGVAVRRDALDRCRQARDQLVAGALTAAIDNALAGGIDADRLREIFDAQLQQATRPDASPGDSP